MAWFNKNKGKSCCNVKIEEIKEEKDSCCNVKIEEVKENDQQK